MGRSRVIEYTFFFASLVAVGYLLWLMLAPFITALALSAIVVIICYPVFSFILRYITRGRRGLAAFISSCIVLSLVVAPVVALSMILVNEFLSFYRSLEGGSLVTIDLLVSDIETEVQYYVPGFELNVSEQMKESVRWLTGNLGSIFAGTVSIVLSLFIALLGTFYLFKDGPRFVSWIISISPLKDVEDETILNRLIVSVRSVATGTVLVALLQGALAATGFAVFGIDRPLLWGTIAALMALIPGIGTLAIMVPGVLFLAYMGDYIAAGGLSLWALATVLIVDNIISPYLMSRGNDMHPLVVLLSVLGGLSVFGPIGFILGPVVVSLFLVLIEVYSSYAEGQAITAPQRTANVATQARAKEEKKPLARATTRVAKASRDQKPVTKKAVKRSVPKTAPELTLELPKLKKPSSRTRTRTKKTVNSDLVGVT